MFDEGEWADVTPIAVSENDHACGRIAYEPDFDNLMGYFRAVLKMDEKSDRALRLTESVIGGNAANYTAWYFRRECLDALGADLKEELDFVTDIALSSPKNYQIWYHRRAVVDKLGDGSNELEFVAAILADDSKNYHAWSHRQFALQRFNLWDGELEFVERLIDEDIRNNSAWNQRWFVVKHTTGFTEKEVRVAELEYALKKLEMAPNNESPANYIRGIMRLAEFDEVDMVKQFVEDMLRRLAGKNDHINAAHPPPVLTLQVEVYVKSGTEQDKQGAVEICEELATKYDTIRAKYWKYKQQKILEDATTVAPPKPPSN